MFKRSFATKPRTSKFSSHRSSDSHSGESKSKPAGSFISSRPPRRFESGAAKPSRFAKFGTSSSSGSRSSDSSKPFSREPRRFESSSSGSSKPFSREPRRFESGASRPSRFGGSSRPSSHSGGFRSNGPRKNFRNPPHSNKRIDVSRFINKATPAEQEVEFVPVHTFADFAISEKLKANILHKGYLKPTPIQDKAIKPLLEGKDVVGIANTGTGKTAAFLIPLINKVLLNREEKVLIMIPTRELALQIQEEFVAFTRGLGLSSVICIGGASIGFQISSLRRHPNFIIATPGRLKDLIQRKCVNLANFKNVVLDEADRMLDMGFIGDIKYLLALMPKERHSLFFSATISPEIQGLIQTFLREPVTISVKSRDTSSNVDQDIIRVTDKSKKIEVLHELLIKSEFNKVLIFGKTKHGVEKLSVVLSQRGFKVESIHGNKTHSRRQRALSLFKQNQVQILVATDVAARGLDIVGVSHVINYDLPATYEDYVHRIGRTGRADKKGKALTFVD